MAESTSKGSSPKGWTYDTSLVARHSLSADGASGMMSDNLVQDPQHTLEAAAIKLNHFRKTQKPEDGEVFAVQLTISEE